MNLFHFFKKSNVVELREATFTKDTFFKAVAKRIASKPKKYHDRENFEYPDTSLYEIKRAIATDSYISESHAKYKEKIFKAGYYLKGETEPKLYLKKRLNIMSHMNETIVEVMFQELADDLIDYSNCFLLKLRADAIPFVQAKPFQSEKCIGGYMRFDPSRVIIVKDQYNNILRYEIENSGYENQRVKCEDMIHFYMNRRPEDKYGTPRLQPVLEDIKALRDIEGDVLTLIHRFCFPLYHVKVGVTQTGYNGTQTDIDDVQDKLEAMTEDGILITNEKVEIKTIGAEGNALDITPYLEYFENRVFSGLNTTDSQMGRDSKLTPDTLEAQIHDSVRHIQKNIALFIEHYVFNELLLEGGFNPILEEADQVKMIFNEISLDTKVKLENHEALKYESNIQTLTETREKIGMDIIVDESDLFVENVTLYTSEVQTNQKTDGAVELAKVQAALAPPPTSTSTTSKKKIPDKNNKKIKTTSKNVRTRNRPQNQHGTYSVKIKESMEHAEKENALSKKCFKIHHKLYNDGLEQKDQAQKDILDIVLDVIRIQKRQAELYCGQNLLLDTEELEALYREEAERFLSKMYQDIQEKEDIDKKSYRLTFTLSYWSKKYFWHCVALIAKSNDLKILKIDFSSEKDKENNPSEISLLEIDAYHIAQNIPPFHPGCKCALDISYLNTLKGKEV